jgi:hypothetical protein
VAGSSSVVKLKSGLAMCSALTQYMSPRLGRELMLEFGYPRWMVPCIGLALALISIGNFHGEGEWRPSVGLYSMGFPMSR